jgi:exonuclease III
MLMVRPGMYVRQAISGSYNFVEEKRHDVVYLQDIKTTAIKTTAILGVD